ncbi:MAG: hypothetical protein JRG91_18020, partial [Deltaproteobacteria bacterium]|nr:hypothetical protein [Deltaproteobacteria bacterium]
MRGSLVMVLAAALGACTSPWDPERDGSVDSWFPDAGGDAYEEPLYEPPECTGDDDCDDGNACTRDGCVEGACTNEPFTGQAFTEPDVQVTDHPYHVGAVSTSWTGATVGIAWTDGRDGGCRELGLVACNTEVFFNRLSGAAEVLDADIRLSGTEVESSLYALRWTGTLHLAMWLEWDRSTTNAPWIARVDPTGHDVGSEVGPGTVERDAFSPAVAWTGSEIALTWIGGSWGSSEPNELHLTRFTPDGTEIADTVLVSDSELSWSSHILVWTGSELAMTYSVSNDHFLGRFTPDGTMVDEMEFRFYSAHGWISGIVWTGSEFGLFYRGALGVEDSCPDTYCNNLNFRRLASDASYVGEFAQITDNHRDLYLTDVLWTGSEWGVSWYRETAWGYESWLTRLGPDGVRVDEALRLRDPSPVEWTGGASVVAWRGQRAGEWNVFENVVGRCA